MSIIVSLLLPIIVSPLSPYGEKKRNLGLLNVEHEAVVEFVGKNCTNTYSRMAKIMRISEGSSPVNNVRLSEVTWKMVTGPKAAKKSPS